MRSVAGKTRMDRWVHRTLLAGVLLSGLLLAIGLTVNLVGGARDQTGAPSPIETLPAAALGGDGMALIDLGLLTLIGTPILRVVVLALGWLLERDIPMAAVAIAVLALLILGMALGLG